MNKYHDKSDFEINKAVAECKYGIGCTGKTQGGDVIVFTDSFTAVFDPCNNPADAMPIINEYGISLMYQEREFQVATNDGNYYCCMSNPLKAAMVIFLMMKDVENE